MPSLDANKLITLTIDSASEVVEADVGTMMRLGQQALAGRDWALARRYFQRVVERQPQHQAALFQLAALAPSPQHTIEYLLHIIELNPQHQAARIALRRTREFIARQLEAARDPIEVVSSQIAACYGPSQPFSAADWAAQRAAIVSRPPLKPPARWLLRFALIAHEWQWAADLLCGVGVHPLERHLVQVSADDAERMRGQLERDRRHRHAEQGYRQALALCAASRWQAAQHQIDRARHFLLPDEGDNSALALKLAELERIVVTALSPRRRG